MEESFPPALVDRINAMGVEGVTAEHLKVGGVRMAVPCGYDVIVDRISHDIPFYRSYLKNCRAHRHARSSTTRSGGAPTTSSSTTRWRRSSAWPCRRPSCCRTREHPPGTTDRSMRNLEYPLDWDGIFDYVGFPAFLKPHDGGGWKDVYKVDTPEEFFAAYDQSGDLCMTLQARGRISGVLPLLRDRPAERPRHALRPGRSRTICAMCPAIRRRRPRCGERIVQRLR